MNTGMASRAPAALLRSRPISTFGAGLRRCAASRPSTPTAVTVPRLAAGRGERAGRLAILLTGGLCFGAYALSDGALLASGSFVGFAMDLDAALLLSKPVMLDAATVVELSNPNERVDPATTLAFPLELAPKSLTSSLALVGFGVRTVSFLRVKVYSAGFYVPEGKDGRWGTERMGEQEAMESFLKDGAPCAMRIVPARNTDFAHLRDGLVRAVQGRLKTLTKAGQLTEEEAERAAGSLNEFKTFFPSRSAARGSELVLVKLPAGAGLAVEFDGQILGTLADPVVGREVFASYFLDGGKEISPKLKQSIVEGFQHRPQ